MADPAEVHVHVEEDAQVRASSAGSVDSRQLGPLRTGRETPPGESRPSSRVAEDDSAEVPVAVRQMEPLPPIGQISAMPPQEPGGEADSASISAVEATSSVIASTMAAEVTPRSPGSSPRSSRFPKVLSYKRELDSEDMSTKSEGRHSNNEGGASKVLIRRRYDGQEVTLVSVECQTDWSLASEDSAANPMIIQPDQQRVQSLDKADVVMKAERPRSKLGSRSSSAGSGRKSSRRGSSNRPSKSRDGGQSLLSEQVSEPAFPVPSREDEYGIPLLELSSSDSSDDDWDEDVHISNKIAQEKTVNTLPSIGPPQILQYQRESDKKNHPVTVSASDLQNLGSASQQGAFEGVCEFCGNTIKPFPSVHQQQTVPPEELYCCHDYREFIEFLITHPLHDQVNRDEDIDVRPHAPRGSQLERSAAKERAVQRMRERELARQQAAIATGIPAAGGAVQGSGGGGVGHANFYQQFTNAANLHFSLGGGLSVDESGAPVRHTGKRLSQAHAGSGMSQSHGNMAEEGEWSDKRLTLDNIQEEGRHGDLQFLLGDIPELDTAGAEGKASKSHSRNQSQTGPTHRKGPKKKHSSAGTQMTLTSYSNTGRFDVAKQMKTINFQLSSVKCMEEGWTLRPPSPLDNEVLETEVFEPEPVLPPWAQPQGKGRKTPGLIQRYYEDGSLFLLLFPDGTGNVFYPSGHLAISIVSQDLGLYSYLIHDDKPVVDPEDPEQTSSLLGVFNPDGHASTYHQNGIVRVCLDPIGGIELDSQGARKRRWSWKDQVQHVHAPPIQPITFAVTPRLAVRIMAQDNITLTYTNRTRSCRFQVGARLKLVAPENLPSAEVDDDQLFREELKTRIETTLDRVSNLLKFPKSPKVDKLPTPGHLSARLAKTEKIRELTREITSGRLKNKKAPVVKVN